MCNQVIIYLCTFNFFQYFSCIVLEYFTVVLKLKIILISLTFNFFVRDCLKQYTALSFLLYFISLMLMLYLASMTHFGNAFEFSMDIPDLIQSE